jgi:hypothetical protein
MKRLLTLSLIPLLIGVPALAQDDNACDGLDLAANEIGIPYQGHCIGVQEHGPTVQPIIIRVTEGLDGVESVMGILVVRTADGWTIAAPEFYEDRGVDGVGVGDEDFAVTAKR